MLRFDPSNEPNRPHISSDIINFKERRQNQLEAPLFFLAQPASVTSVFFSSVPSKLCFVVPSVFAASASAPPVRGYLRIGVPGRNPFFQETSSFFEKLVILFKNRVLAHQIFHTPQF